MVQAGESLKISFGIRLRKYREAAGVDADSFGRSVGVHANTIYRIERGEQWIGADILEKICKTLKIDAAQLFTDGTVYSPPTPEEALEIIARALKDTSRK